MKKNIIIVGTGPLLGLGIAKKFGNEGYAVGLISRNAENLQKHSDTLTEAGIENYFAAADVSEPTALKKAIEDLKTTLKSVDVLVYNTAALRAGDIFEETAESLTNDFKINVAGALESFYGVHEELKKSSGAFVLTGGFFAEHPNVAYGSLSIGKSGLKNLALQLNEKLEPEGIFSGIVTIKGYINEESETHNPTLLANKYFEFVNARKGIEVIL